MHILVINPGSTSTKIAVYEDETPVMLRNISHSIGELSQFPSLMDQLAFRRDLVIEELRRIDMPFHFDAVIGRGGLGKPIQSGVYEVNERFCDDMRHATRKHPCNLGCIIAYEIASRIPGCHSFTADPVVVDEMNELARVSGSPLMPRASIWHALNQRAIARRHARETGHSYEELDLIVCHLGGGISVTAHHRGRATDTNNALDGEGPFSPDRAGTLPAADLIRLCFSGRYTEEQLLRRIAGQAGLYAHLGTNNVKEIMARIDAGDDHARLIVDAMIYHTAKSIAAQGAVLCGHVDAILLTGGMAHSAYITDGLRRRVEFLAPVYVYPGEDEMEALALNALAVLQGRCRARRYE